MNTTKNKIVYEKDINDFKGKASLVFLPENIEEISRIVRQNNSDIIPRGAGMSFSGGVTADNSVVVDMSKMKRIIHLDTLKKVIYLEAGVNIGELNLELERFGLEFPINPLFSNIRTLGGLIATNSSGSREIKYGRIRNWIDSLEIVNGKGEILLIQKSDSGDFIGFEGTTGIIVRAKLRLTNKKERTISIFKSDSLEDLLVLNKNLKLEQDISSLELFGKQTSKLLGLEEKYHLFAEFESERGKMKKSEYEKFMKLRDKTYLNLASAGHILIEDPKIFMENIIDFLMVLEENNIPYVCNSSSGIVYCFFKREEAGKKTDILNLVKKLRGKVSDSLGFGITKKHFLEKSEIDIIKRVKSRHDPLWKFNRNKLIDYSLMNVKESFGINAENIKELEKESDKITKAEVENVEREKTEKIAVKPETNDKNKTKTIEIQKQSNEPELTKEEKANVRTNPHTQKEVSKSERERIKKIAGGAF